MSGRDLKNFVTIHRTDNSDVDGLVSRVRDGVTSNKYKPVDYDQLRALTASKKVAGQEALGKVHKLQQASKQGREQNLVKQHKGVWHQEFLRLTSHRRRHMAEIDAHVRQNMDGYTASNIYKDFAEYETSLNSDLMYFKQHTVDPIWTLREDLQFWIQEHKCGTSAGNPDVEHPEVVMSTVKNVRSQQKQIMDKLEQEQRALEQDLHAGDLPEIATVPREKTIQTGIPQEAFDLECPDLQLKAQILQEFILLDHKYVERLEILEDQHSAAISDATGGWSRSDHFTFLYVVEQYPHDLTSRRALYIDRLRRHLPSKNRADIVRHEEWWLQFKYYHERRKDLINDWIRDRKELLNRSKVVFSEVSQAAEVDQLQTEYRQEQRQLCDQLYNKVREWREHKVEVLQLEQEQLERRRTERQKQEAERQDKEHQQRQQDKNKIHEFHEASKQCQRQSEMRDRKRLEELKERMAEQAAHDRQRVNYRDQQQRVKEETRQQQRDEAEAAELERERVLEALRQQVRPHVEGDLLRLWSDTEAWRARQEPDTDQQDLQRPMFEINTFSSKQITQDPRVRMEAALREAGLHGNDYARQVLSKVQPPQLPRRDMESTVFKNQ